MKIEGYHPTCRIIPVSRWLINMLSKSSKSGCSPSKWPKWLVNRDYKLLTNWDDAPSNATMRSYYLLKDKDAGKKSLKTIFSEWHWGTLKVVTITGKGHHRILKINKKVKPGVFGSK